MNNDTDLLRATLRHELKAATDEAILVDAYEVVGAHFGIAPASLRQLSYDRPLSMRASLALASLLNRPITDFQPLWSDADRLAFDAGRRQKEEK